MKIDVTPIVVSHFATLRNNSNGRYSALDITVFYGLPLLAAGVAVYLGWRFDSEALNSILAAFAIFAGLLLNLLLLVFTFSLRSEEQSMVARKRSELIRELHYNIAYSILVSIALVIVTMSEVAILKMAAAKSTAPDAFTGPFGTGLVVFLTVNFGLTLLMILKRIYVILNYQVGTKGLRKTA